MSVDHKGRVAFITGGSSGIGRATAIEFVKAGAIVAIASRDEHKAQGVLNDIRVLGGEALFLQADVCNTMDIERACHQISEAYGRLDFAFNNAGVGCMLGSLTELSEEDWDYVTQVNLKGVFICMQQEVKKMIFQGSGVIINNASAAGVMPMREAPYPYVASKFGILGLTKQAAAEFGPKNIRINAICPAFIETPMLGQDTHRYDDVINQRVPLRRMASPLEVAKLVIWLCSEDAAFITGASIPVDGGLLSSIT